MATIYCELPKELIVGKEGNKRTQEYALGISPSSPKFTVKWEDYDKGLIARDVPEDVARIILKRSGYNLVEPPKQGKVEAPVKTVTTASDPVTTRGRKHAEK